MQHQRGERHVLILRLEDDRKLNSAGSSVFQCCLPRGNFHVIRGSNAETVGCVNDFPGSFTARETRGRFASIEESLEKGPTLDLYSL